MQLALLLINSLFFLAACGGSDNVDRGTTQLSPASNATSSSVGRFSKDIGKGCDLLTADLVGATFNFPADSFKQTKVMGCLYTWKNETEQINATISLLQVHKTAVQADSWFNKATANRSSEEVQAELDQVAAALDRSDKLDTAVKKSMASTMLNAVGAEPVSFEDVAGVGDEARAGADGSIYVRAGNLTFVVSAYQGPNEPDIDFSGMAVKQILEATKQQSKAWASETSAQRKKNGVQLASAVVDAL